MIELPGSFSGMLISPRPARGPEASQRTSLAIFISEQASVLSAPWANTSASWPANASNLFGALTKGCLVSAAILAAALVGELGMCVQSSSHRRAAQASS